MAWPASVSGDFLSGSSAETRGQDLYDRALCAKGGGTTFWFAEVTETGTSYLDKATLEVRLPECIRSGDTIQLTVRGVQAGGGVGNYRARETGDPVNGSEQTLAGALASSTSEITVPDDSWAGQIMSIAVQLKTNGSGTATADGVNIMANLRFKT